MLDSEIEQINADAVAETRTITVHEMDFTLSDDKEKQKNGTFDCPFDLQCIFLDLIKDRDITSFIR